MRTYWCKECEKCVDIDMKISNACKCGNVFGSSNKPSHHINMRTTWSGTTKIEFSEKTIGNSIEGMGGDLDR